MVTATQTTSDAAALAHLLDTVLALSATSPIRLSLQLNGYDNLQSVVGIFESELESLEYVPLAVKEGVSPLPVKLLMAHQQLLCYFLHWMSHLRNTNEGPLSPYKIVSLARDDFNTYRMSPPAQLSESLSTHIQQSSTPMVIPGNHSCSAVAEFKQGVKCDKMHYPVLMDDCYWDNFYRTFVVTTILHNVDNVLDPAYSPTDPDQISLLKEQKKFVYSALEHCLQTKILM
jgi:hypothetical protein